MVSPKAKTFSLVVVLLALPFLYLFSGLGNDQQLSSSRRILSIPESEITGKDAVFTSWYSFRKDPQRGILVSNESIDYIYDLYATATHYKVPLVVFHDGLTSEFVEQWSNDYVTFEHVTPDPAYSTNDFRFFPYLDYLTEHGLDSVLMVDASDVFFNSNPFDYIREHEGPKDQLFMSLDAGGKKSEFSFKSWKVAGCYGEDAKNWPGDKRMYNAGVWGGKGPAVQCVLECVTDQIEQLRGRGNCNMPVVNYCVNHGPCGDEVAPIHEDPKFVNPWKHECENPEYAVVHNKCPETEYGRKVDIVDGRVMLTKTGIVTTAQRANDIFMAKRQVKIDARKKARREARFAESK